jgi:predicted nucleic acid-binding protein
MIESYKKPCLDSSVFIGGMNDEIRNCIRRGVLYRDLLRRARMGEFQIHISAAAIAEVYKLKTWGTATTQCLDEFMSLVDEKDLLMPIEVDRNTAIQAHELCRKHASLRPFDAIHLACALAAECDYLLTWDTKLSKVVHSKIKVENPKIHNPDMFAESEFATPDEQDAWNLANPSRVEDIELLFKRYVEGFNI